MDGWTQKHRKIFESRLGNDCRLMYLFDWLIARARYRPGWVKTNLHLERGQLVTSREELGKVMRRACRFKKPTSKTAWLWLKNLEKGGEVSLQTSSRGTIVTICNYDTYNPLSGENVQPDVQRMYSEGSADVQQGFTKKKEKKEKKGKEDSLSAGADDTTGTAKDNKLLDAERRFITLWNSLKGARPIRGDTFGAARRRKFRTRMKDDQWRNDVKPAFAKFPLQSTVGNGEWKPSVDFILRPDSLTKILEGSYDWEKNKRWEPPEEPEPDYI